MIMPKKNILLLLSCVFLSVSVIGCALPLPATLNIVPPSPDVPPEIVAFSGIWEGKWGAIQDTIIVIEKIDTQTAEIIISFGKAEAGIRPQNAYYRITATVLPGPIIEWNIEGGTENDCPCTITLNMDKGLNNLTAFHTFERSKTKWRADLTRRK